MRLIYRYYHYQKLHYQRFILVSAFLLCSLIYGLGQTGNVQDQGARSLSLSGISTTLDGSDALFNNFSNITRSSGFGLIATSQRRFNLDELTVASFGAHTQLNNFGHLGLTFSHYGFDEFQQQRLSLLYARQLNKAIALSANFDLNTIRISEFGSSAAISFGLGISGIITDNLRYGFYIFNPEKIEIAFNTEIETALKFGLSYMLSQKLAVYSDLEKIIDETLNVIVGFEYMVEDKISLRMGVHSNPGGFSFGLQYRFNKRFIIDGGATYNTLLGFTPGFSLKYNGISTPTEE